MAGASYKTPAKALWFFVIDLSLGNDGERRRRERRGFPSEAAARKTGTEAQKAYGEASAGAEGGVAAN